MAHFNIVACYEDDGGPYEWQGEAADDTDAIAQAQAQAYEDNVGGDTPYDMLDPDQISVIDVTASVDLKAEVVAALRDAGQSELADRFERAPAHF